LQGERGKTQKMKQKLIAVSVALLAAVVGCGIMLMLPGVGEPTAAMVGTAAAVAGWKTVMSRQGG
jgi:hypothetical protein